MDNYVIRTKPTVGSGSDKARGKSTAKKRQSESGDEPGTSKKAKHPLSGSVARDNAPILSSLNNSIVTSSDCYQRTLHIQSCATGHQEAHARKAGSWMQKRNYKLAVQGRDRVTNVFAGVVVYLSGPTGPMSVQQAIATIQEQGGQVRYMFSSECTHIVSMTTLSGKKNNDYLRVKSRKAKAKIVRPEWIIDSVENGKRLPEHLYAITIDQNQGSVLAHLTTSAPLMSRHASEPMQGTTLLAPPVATHDGCLVISSSSQPEPHSTSQDSDEMPPSAQP